MSDVPRLALRLRWAQSTYQVWRPKSADDHVEHVALRRVGQKTRKARAFVEGREQRLPRLGQLVPVALAFDVAIQQRMSHTAADARALQQAEHEMVDRRARDAFAAQQADLLGQDERQPVHGRGEPPRVHDAGGAAGFLQRAAQPGVEAVLHRDFPRQPLAQVGEQVGWNGFSRALDERAIGRQLAQIGRHERGRQLLIAGRARPDGSPMRHHVLGEIAQTDRRVVVQRRLHGSPQTKAEGARAEKRRPVRGVLDRVGEGQQLLVGVERAGVDVADRHRRQAWRPASPGC